MEDKKTKELNFEEMDQVSGGAGPALFQDRCPLCRGGMEFVERNKYWCTNEECKGYHVLRYMSHIV